MKFFQIPQIRLILTHIGDKRKMGAIWQFAGQKMPKTKLITWEKDSNSLANLSEDLNNTFPINNDAY